MQVYIIKLSYDDNPPFSRWVVGSEDFGSSNESQGKVIDFLISNNVSPNCIKFEYMGDKRPEGADFENKFRESFRAKLKSIS